MDLLKKVLVISVHPDDETLGCGGTILRHKKEGSDIYWLVITNIHENDGWTKETVLKRADEINTVSSRYGFKETYNLEFPPTKLDELPIGVIISKISDVINKVQPELIYTINRSDIHSDHKISFQAIISSAKNFRYPFIKKILMYECLSETEFAPALAENVFLPNVFVDISEFMDKKIEIMSVFESEIMLDNWPRSYNTIKALGSYRGSRIGVKFAEAFQLLFERI
jgi:LmbE family N-acetylglucosaminyl deacetylase